jgi:membrane carboxypeptidase/penicillin-binding protein PbpC
LLSLLPPAKSSRSKTERQGTKLVDKEIETRSEKRTEKGVLSKNIHELPKHLLKFSLKEKKGFLDDAEFSIQFPKEGSILFLKKTEHSYQPIHIILKGGMPPYYGFVNGEPLDQSSQQSRFIWTPKTPGFVEFSVVDSQGNCTAVAIELKS